ncbi:MAG: tRNA-intron lyase [Thermoproteota archaeon]|nr:tRNA-intron lyase [Thermoproteota archaeon]
MPLPPPSHSTDSEQMPEKLNPALSSSSEVQSQIIEGRLIGRSKIVIDEKRFQDELRTKGYGEKQDDEYVLESYEALYLFYIKRLKLQNRPNLDFDSLFELLFKYNKTILSTFLVYRDLRNRGYVAKEGFGFGNDFRVYERGDYEKKPAKYVVFGINEGTNTTAQQFAFAVSQIQKMGKEAVVAVIERRGEVIYYKASTINLTNNNFNINNNVRF